MHKQGYAHRDIKLDNIMFDENFNLKLIDLGFVVELVKEDGEVNVQTTGEGTELYLAPEILQGEQHQVDHADVFAFGVVLYCMHIGKTPFNQSMLPENYPSYEYVQDYQYKKLLSSEYLEEDNNQSKEFKCLIQKILSYNPKERYTAF